MLVIREAQMDAFRRERIDLAMRELAAYVRRSSSALVSAWSDSQLHAGLMLAREKAGAYAITDPVSVAEYFEAMVTYSAEFDQHSAVQTILRDSPEAPNHRIHAVWRSLSNADWSDVAATCAAPMCPEEVLC